MLDMAIPRTPETRDSLLNSEAMEAQKPNHQCLGIVFDVVVVPQSKKTNKLYLQVSAGDVTYPN